jgi:hypothetical protein
MRELGLRSREKEIGNLPDEVVLSLGGDRVGQPDREGLVARSQSCSSLLLNHDMTRSDFYETLYQCIEVPDEYSFPRRIIGLYPLFVIPVMIGTKGVRNEFTSWYEMKLDELPVEGNLVSCSPAHGLLLDEKEVRGLIQRSMVNSLGVPRLEAKEELRVVAHFAPIIIQDVGAPYDQFGRVLWDGARLTVDTEKPSVYYYLTHAALKGEAVLQINYVIWYFARAGKRAPWIERGHLDGLTVRISLDRRGRPFMVDVMNNCGCYHFFVPVRERVDRVNATFPGLAPFVPQWLPEIPAGRRLGIRVNSGWHQVERLLASDIPSDSIAYELMPYDVLEALPRESLRTESMFTSKGIGKGSDRNKEKVIFFSMGVPAVGSMRQRGRSPIALVGRAHFDDPQLFEKNFVFK